MRILIVDSTIERDSWGSQELQRYARETPGATIHVRRAPEDDLPRDPHAFDRIIFSGSKTAASEDAPWIDKLLDFMRRTLDGGQPMLGVCFGHQMLARVLGGRNAVGRAKLGEVGWTRIELTGESQLFRGLPGAFYSFSAHLDEIRTLAPGLRNLARSSACAIQAVQLGDRPVFGIQFHPERDVAGSEKTFQWARRRLADDDLDPRAVLGDGSGGRFYDAKVAQKVFGNFLTL